MKKPAQTQRNELHNGEKTVMCDAATENEIPDEVIDSIAKTLLPGIKAFFESEKGQQEFAEWKKKRENKEGVA